MSDDTALAAVYGRPAPRGGATALAGDAGQARRAYHRSLVAEVRMLVDYVSAQPDRSLDQLKARECTTGGAKDIDPCRMLAIIDALEAKLEPRDARLDADDCSSLQLFRDALTTAARPATGQTVAFTAMVVGNRRGAGSESRASLAGGAYPGLVNPAARLRWWQGLLVLAAITMTLVAAWESTHVALGKSLMQHLTSLRAEQTQVLEEKARIAQEDATGHGAGADALKAFLKNDEAAQRVRSFDMCDRPAAAAWEVLQHGDPSDIATNFNYASDTTAHVAAEMAPILAHVGAEKLKLYASDSQRAVCERDRVLGLNIHMVQRELEQFRDDWPAMAGAFYWETSWVVNHATGWMRKGEKGDDATAGFDPRALDVEFMIAPDLVVWGNYVLPVIYGLLGALIYVLLDQYGRTRTSLLDPRDITLSAMRLVLGLVTGACVGLFFSTYGPTTPAPGANLIDALSLSASGLAFLAGFGVEGVFGFLQALVERVFPKTVK